MQLDESTVTYIFHWSTDGDLIQSLLDVFHIVLNALPGVFQCKKSVSIPKNYFIQI